MFLNEGEASGIAEELEQIQGFREVIIIIIIIMTTRGCCCCNVRYLFIVLHL